MCNFYANIFRGSKTFDRSFGRGGNGMNFMTIKSLISERF
jgi:hypothetical protein